MELFLNDKLGKISYEINDTPVSTSVLILAHGAGAGMYHPFMVALAEALCNEGISVIRFNFPYLEAGRKAPGSPNDAIFTWHKMVEETEKIFYGKSLFVAGKSYGGRMASHLLAEVKTNIKGIVYFGFPLHAPGRDSKDRANHLDTIDCPQLFIQGEKDKLATIELIREVVNDLPHATLHEISDADHSFHVPKSAGISKSEMIRNLAKISADWMRLK